MEIYRTEEEQIEAIKKWWKNNKKLVITGVAVGFIVVFSWYRFQSHKIIQAKAASDIYQSLIKAENKEEAETAKEYAQQLFKQHKESAYASYAALFMAKYAVKEEDYATAKMNLNWVIAHTDQEQIAHIARLRLARVLIATDQLDEAKNLLNKGSQGEFSASYSELKEAIARAQEG